MSLLITFEGPEGSGKTTQANKLKAVLEERGYSVLLTREPGGTEIGDAIRDILLDPRFESMDALTELFLYEANRSQHVSDVIRPALKNGDIVISDRFSDASLVYQGKARGIGSDTVERLNDLATGSLTPDLTIVLDVNPEDGLMRARGDSDNFTGDGDRIERESETFHETVTEAYRDLAEQHPDRCVLLSRTKSIETIHHEILERVEGLLNP